MTWKVPLFDLAYGTEEEEAVLEVLRSRWLTMGEKTEAFERAFAEMLGSENAVFVSSGTAALRLAARVLWFGAGDEVIVPALTFVATANVVLYEGATPVLADVVGTHDLTIDPEDIERKITDSTRAVIVMHYGGYPCDMGAITAIAEKHGLALVEDACHAPGARYGDHACGTLGHAGCFSFQSNNNLSTGEGGMITLADPDHEVRARALRSHAITESALVRYKGQAWGYNVVETGYNFKPTEISAALGLAQLAKLEAGNETRSAITSRYRERLAGVAGVEVPFGPEWAGSRPAGTRSAHHLMEVVLPEETDRARVQQALADAGIQTSVHYRPLHTFSSPLLAAAPARGLEKVNALAGRLLTLPLWPGMADDDVDLVVDSLAAAL